MYITDYGFTEYYRQFLTFEADGLTEKCRDMIDVNEEDCYALCSSWINEEGEIMFNVLAIGPDWQTCTKGLEKDDMLAQLTLDEIMDCEVRIAIGDYDMTRKNSLFLSEQNETDEETEELRHEARFDPFRDLRYPDVVEIVHLYEGNLYFGEMQLKEIRGPFVMGEIVDFPAEDEDIHEGEITYTLPCVYPDGVGLFRIFGEDTMGEDEEESVKELIRKLSEEGFSFNGVHIRS